MERNKEECNKQPLNPEDQSDSAKVPSMMSKETGETNASEEDEICTTLEEVVGTLDEIEEAEEERAKMAELLLGGCLDLVCTYPEVFVPFFQIKIMLKGYKFRQPLYSCKTCFSKTGQLAGICYACSENCHEGHDMVELYTKRNFCCDCGNSKFENKCKLFEVCSSIFCQKLLKIIRKRTLQIRTTSTTTTSRAFFVCAKSSIHPKGMMTRVHLKR